MGQTRVDLLHLLEDLRDAYPGALEETILTEIVANSLDSGARSISLRTAPGDSVLVVVDDGRGMSRRELSRYHDIAASSKRRGQGIGFAGVGIKLGLLACEEVLTETRQESRHAATRWKLASRQRAPWHFVDPHGFVSTPRGTGVCLRLRNPLSPLLDPGFIEAALRRHFEPLLDVAFEEIVAPQYGGGVEFRVNGSVLEKTPSNEAQQPVAVTLPRRRKPSGRGVLTRSAEPLPEEARGVAVSTLGKVIRRGWDWLGVTPLAPQHVGGLIEVPALAEALTLNKADFLRSGPRGMVYASLRKAIQQAVMAQLQAWGEGPDRDEAARRRAARPLERDLETVLVELAEDFPTLAPLVEQRAGGQKRLASWGSSGGAVPGLATPVSRDVPAAIAPDTGEPVDAREAAPSEPTPPEGEAADQLPLVAAGKPRPARYRLAIQFEDRPDLPELARLIESTVWVNTAHPAHARAAASRSEGYHVALAVAMALAPEVVEPSQAQAFLNAFLTCWGEALGLDRRRRRAR